MTDGTVKWFSGAKGYGFIAPTEGGADLFLHHSQIQNYDFNGVADNRPVEFEIGDGHKGPQATEVRLL
jgi:cold shock protein